MIELHSVTKNYGNRCAVHNISFSAPSNSVTALIGLNGAGKTTILKAVCSMHYADSGVVLVNGIDAAENSIANKKQTAFMSERSAFFPEYTVYEFLCREAAVLFAGSDKTEQKERIVQASRLCGIHNVFSQKIGTLSHGWQRRLAFSRCLLSDPQVLVLDEPASGLDPRQSADMRSLIEKLSEHKTVFFSTHLIREMETLCSKIVVLHKGSVIFQGSQNELCTLTGEKTLEKSFLNITSKTQEQAL